MPHTISVKETRSAYSVSLNKMQLADEPVYVERDGKPWAVLLPVAQFEQLVALQKRIADAAWCQEQLAHLHAERAMFQRLLPELLKTQDGKFVAIQGEQVVDSDSDESALAQRTRERGVRPVYIEPVTATPAIVELPSPEVITRC